MYLFLILFMFFKADVDVDEQKQVEKIKNSQICKRALRNEMFSIFIHVCFETITFILICFHR